MIVLWYVCQLPQNIHKCQRKSYYPLLTNYCILIIVLIGNINLAISKMFSVGKYNSENVFNMFNRSRISLSDDL